MDTQLLGRFFTFKVSYKFIADSNSIWQSKFEMLAHNVKMIEQLKNPTFINIDSD